MKILLSLLFTLAFVVLFQYKNAQHRDTLQAHYDVHQCDSMIQANTANQVAEAATPSL